MQEKTKGWSPMVPKINDIESKEEEDVHTNLIAMDSYYGIRALKLQEYYIYLL